ncbi:MAG: class I SAM-dependent methyltransferase [Magnetococcales bacterium]|nr:class I SAM-dependent methyltransferase [Magnetococcales bacterium]
MYHNARNPDHSCHTERPNSSSEKQRNHYHAVHNTYREHYFDAESMTYRDLFLYQPMLNGLDLNNMDVLEVASGAGFNSKAWLEKFPHGRFSGLDISSYACADFVRNVGCEAWESDLAKGPFPDAQFDVVFVIGGLHHCVNDLPAVLRNIASLIRPGGYFLMMEPNSEYILEPLRKLWYRKDAFFEADTEEALSHDALNRLGASWFDAKTVRHMGGPGYFLILNSMILRLPKGIKKALSIPIMALERVYNLLPGKLPFPYFVAKWQKKAS